MKNLLFTVFVSFFMNAHYSQSYEEILGHSYQETNELITSHGFSFKSMEKVPDGYLANYDLTDEDNKLKFIEFTVLYDSNGVSNEFGILTSSEEVYDAYFDHCVKYYAELNPTPLDYHHSFKGVNYVFLMKEEIVDGVSFFMIKIEKK